MENASLHISPQLLANKGTTFFHPVKIDFKQALCIRGQFSPFILNCLSNDPALCDPDNPLALFAPLTEG